MKEAAAIKRITFESYFVNAFFLKPKTRGACCDNTRVIAVARVKCCVFMCVFKQFDAAIKGGGIIRFAIGDD